jgi:hypothetical protein
MKAKQAKLRRVQQQKLVNGVAEVESQKEAAPSRYMDNGERDGTEQEMADNDFADALGGSPWGDD